MSVPRYNKYKKSGVEWLGDVPEHWDTMRLGYYFCERREKVSDKDFEALSVTKNGIVPQLETAAKSDDSDNRKKVCSGDFVINSRSDRKGSGGLAWQDGSVSLINTVITPLEAVDSKFIEFLLKSVNFQEEFYRHGQGIVADLWTTKYSEMKNIILAIPTLPEQKSIAAFLDRETAKIDALVAEQERLIELLKEKRQAVISHAVTKGLNPKAPMKPSGIDWLGDIPAHWNALSLRRISARVDTGGTPSSEYFSEQETEGDIPWFTPGDFSADEIILNTSNKKILNSAHADGEVKIFSQGSVLLVGIGATLGKIGYVSKDCSSNQQINAIKTNDKMYGYFLAYYLSSKSDLMRFLSNASTIGILNQEKTKEITVAVPPMDEQKEICDYLDKKLPKLKSLISEAHRVIDLLQERRTALISAAVTGKIDVRGIVSDQNKEAA